MVISYNIYYNWKLPYFTIKSRLFRIAWRKK